MLTLLNECYSFGSNKNKKKYREMAAKRDSCDGTSIDTSSGNPIIVSVLIPGEDSKKYLLAKCGDRGWWLPHGKVHKHEAIKVAAQRVATEVSGFVPNAFQVLVSVADPDFPEGTPKVGLFFQLFAENCMNMKEFGPPLSRGYDELDPPMGLFLLFRLTERLYIICSGSRYSGTS